MSPYVNLEVWDEKNGNSDMAKSDKNARRNRILQKDFLFAPFSFHFRAQFKVIFRCDEKKIN